MILDGRFSPPLNLGVSIKVSSDGRQLGMVQKTEISERLSQWSFQLVGIFRMGVTQIFELSKLPIL
jgi:hypothetical protein